MIKSSLRVSTRWGVITKRDAVRGYALAGVGIIGGCTGAPVGIGLVWSARNSQVIENS
jgi:hypothetical protein